MGNGKQHTKESIKKYEHDNTTHNIQYATRRIQ